MSKSLKSSNDPNLSQDFKNLDFPSTRNHILPTNQDFQTKNNLMARENQQLKSELCDKIVEAQELQAELTAIRELIDMKDITIGKLKEELKQATTANNKAAGEQRFLQEQMLAFQQEQEQLLDDYEQVLSKIEIISKEKAQAMHQADELSTRVRILERQNEEFSISRAQESNEIYQLRIQIKERTEETNLGKQQLENLRIEAKGYIDDIHHLNQINQRAEESSRKFREEILRLQEKLDEQYSKQQITDRESSKIREISEEIRRLERENFRYQEQLREASLIISQKDEDSENRYCEISKLQKSNKELRDDNYVLSSKLLEVGNQNDKLRRLVEELQTKVEYLSEHDKEIKAYLGRKEKLLQVREQAERELQIALDSFSLSK